MKKVEYLIKYARAQVGRPYWGGTYGAKASPDLLAYKRKQYPALYPYNANPPFENQYGEKVHDCNGLINGAHVCKTVNGYPAGYPADYKSVSGLYTSAKDKGKLNNDTALINGMLLFRGNRGHVGVYDNGEVIHAKGHKYGVVCEKFKVTEWQEWAIADYFFEYPGEPISNIKVGDIVMLDPDATVYGKSIHFAAWVYQSKLYVRELKGKRAVISIYKTGDITGAVSIDELHKV